MAKSVNVLAARSRIEWTASLMMPRLPVSSPTTSLPITIAAPMNTEPSATSSGLRPRAFIVPTLVAAFGPRRRLLQHRGGREELLFGSQCDQKIALFQAQAGTRVDMQRAVLPADRQQLRRVRAQQPCLVHRLAHRCHTLLDEHLLDDDLGHPVVERVENVDERWPHRQFGHA